MSRNHVEVNKRFGLGVYNTILIYAPGDQLFEEQILKRRKRCLSVVLN